MLIMILDDTSNFTRAKENIKQKQNKHTITKSTRKFDISKQNEH